MAGAARIPPEGWVGNKDGQTFVMSKGQMVPAVMGAGGRWVPAGLGDPAASPVSAGQKEDREALATMRTDAQQSLNASTEAERFARINQGQDTGGWGNLSMPWGGATINDARAAFDSSLARMKSITNRVAPNLRPPGSGSSSDRDTAVYISGFPNINAPSDANAASAADWHTKSDHDAARSAFADVWFAKRGTLLGMPAAFNKFWADRQASGLSNYGADGVASARRMASPAPAAPLPGDGWTITPHQ